MINKESAIIFSIINRLASRLRPLRHLLSAIFVVGALGIAGLAASSVSALPANSLPTSTATMANMPDAIIGNLMQFGVGAIAAFVPGMPSTREFLPQLALAPKTNCIDSPHLCGYPDATNTGYLPTGVTLDTNGITINSDGDFVITEDGTVIDSKRIDGCVVVKASNVTIKRSLITNCQAYYNIRLYPGSPNFLLEDVEVDGNNVEIQNAALVDDGVGPVTVRRLDMHNVGDGPHPGENWVIEDSYIHDLYGCGVCHNDNIQSAGAINVIVRHNTLTNYASGKNSNVLIATEQGPVSDFIVEDNLLSGGQFQVQSRDGGYGNGAPTGVIIRNNRVVPDWVFYGPWDIYPGQATVTGNVRDDNNEPINEW